MNKRCYTAVASVLYLVCFTSACGLTANLFEIIKLTSNVKFLSTALIILSGYFASFFMGLRFENPKKAKRHMKNYLFLLFGFYLLLLADFTLIDENFGRNIFGILSWDKNALGVYLKDSTNFVPFYTVRLFINGYINHKLTFGDTVLNLIGNFMVFMPLPFFVKLFFEKNNSDLKMLITVLVFVIGIELLQFLFMTGACDIDDVILNTCGAMLFYYLSKVKKVSNGLSRLTFGVWKINEVKA